MITSAPAGFDLERFYQGVYLFQTWELFPGRVTRGVKDVVGMLSLLGVPEDLTGKRVLDIGAWNGFFSFECVRRGASEVVSFGPDDPDRTGWNRTRDLLGIDNARYVRASVYDLTPEVAGMFDVVLFLGVIYHLRHPLLAFDRIHDVCRGMLYVDTPFIDNVVVDITVSAETKARILAETQAIHALPMLYFTAREETGDLYNWFMPNLRAVRALVEAGGFAVEHAADDGGAWCWLSARKAERYFDMKLEGFNPYAVNFAG